MSHQFKANQFVPQPYSRISTPVPSQAFTPPPSVHFISPGTPGSAGPQRLKPLTSTNSSLNLAGLPGATPDYHTSPAGFPNSTPGNNAPGSSAAGAAAAGGALIHPREYQKPQVSQWLNTFEGTLAQLVESISKFRPSVKIAESLVSAEAELAASIAELAEHQRLARRIYELRQESKTLDDELNVLLVTLSDCRRTLRALPKPDEKFLRSLPEGVLDYTRELVQLNDDDGLDERGMTLEDAIRRRRSSLAFSGKFVQERPKVSAKELLEYATKITKFTSAPPGFDGRSRDNPDFNYPWPSEDELRRGMLALSAMSGTAEVAVGEKELEEQTKKEQQDEQEKQDQQDQQDQKDHQAAAASISSGGRDPASGSDAAAGGDKTAASGAGANNKSAKDEAAGGTRRSSLVDYGARPSVAAQTLDLGLFDPDEDDDDDDDEDMEDVA